MTFLRKFQRVILPLAFLVGLSINSRAQTVAVSGDIKNVISGSVPDSRVQICFTLLQLDGQAVTSPSIPGVGVIIANKGICVSPVSGHWTAPNVYANDVIRILDTPNTTMYEVSYLVNGQFATGANYIFNVADVTEDLNTKIPIGVPPVVTAPTGDSTYARLSGSNQPFLGAITAPGAALSATSNSVDIFTITRATDTSPTGNFVNYKSQAGASLFRIDINGNVTAPNIPSGTIDTGTGTTNAIPKFSNGASGIFGNSSLSDNGTTVNTPENLTVGGTFAVTGISTLGALSSKNENGKAIIHVDQYASWAAALADCPSTGCILDGRSPNTPVAIGTIDPGTTAAITVLLGPLQTYTLDHFVLRSGLRVYGSGVENIQGTTIQAVGAGPPFIMPASASPQSVQGVVLQDFSLACTAGNTAQDGIFADVSVGNLPSGSNFEAFDFERLTISLCKGSAIHFKGPVAGATSVDQFGRIAFVNENVPASDTTVGSCIRLEGSVGQINWENNNCTQQGGSPTETGIFIGATGSGDSVGPYSQWFEGTTIQNMNVGTNLSGCGGCSFRDTHLELDNIPWQTNVISTSVLNQNLVLDSGTANGNVAVNAGNGIFLDMSSANNNLGTGVAVKGWTFAGNPDKLCKGINGVNVVFTDNRFQQGTPSVVTTTCAPFGLSTSTTTLNTFSLHYAFITGASGGAITTLTSGLGPGEVITLFASATFSLTTGGNINLGGNAAPIVVPAGQTIQLINGDNSGSNLWYVIGLQNQIKSQRFGSLCSTGTTQGSSCITAVTWTTAFADSNYTVSCTGRTPTNTPGGLDVESITAAGFTVRVFNLGAGSAATYADADCIARHD